MNDIIEDLLSTKYCWIDARNVYDRAKLDLEYQEKRLKLLVELIQHSGEDTSEEVQEAIKRVELVGLSTGAAVKKTLERLKKATPNDLAAAMSVRGFYFSGHPAREVHGALVKQSWAKRDSKTGEWEYHA